MKVDMEKLGCGGSGGWDVRKLTMAAGICLAAIMLAGGVMLHGSIQAGEGALAESGYDPVAACPTFTVEQWGMAEGAEGLQELFAPRATDWSQASAIEEMTGLRDGCGWRLSEVRAGHGGALTTARLSDGDTVTFTNNPDHPGLSVRQDGTYEKSGGGYVICIHDGDTVQLVFDEEASWSYIDADAYDYDVTDGGYYLSDDASHKGDLHGASGQAYEEGPVYLDMTGCGIQFPGNYSGDGQKIAFGGPDIGLDAGGWTYAADGSPLTGLAAGTEGGRLLWADGVSAPDLFGGEAAGRTEYLSGEYFLAFSTSGGRMSLKSAESQWGTASEWDGPCTDSFWIMDGSPSCGTDGHDPLWGSGMDAWAYRTGDRAPEALPYEREAHDRFFGLSWDMDFVLPAGYTGPLSVSGYSDDDMFVFLTELGDDGEPLAGTQSQVLDLGGLHAPTWAEADLWEVLDPVPWGGDAKRFRLSVFWLERDGYHASMGFEASLPPDAPAPGAKDACSVMGEALQPVGPGGDRTFIFDDGTHDRYHVSYDGGSLSAVSGEPFMVPDGAGFAVNGVRKGSDVSLSEDGRGAVWHLEGGSFKEGAAAPLAARTGAGTKFVSSDEPGTVAIAVDAPGTPEGGFSMMVRLAGMSDAVVPFLEGGQAGALHTDKDGWTACALDAGQCAVLYGIPAGTEVLVQPMAPDGWRLSGADLDGAYAGQDGMLHGEASMAVVFTYGQHME